MASDEEMLDVNFPVDQRQYMSLSTVGSSSPSEPSGDVVPLFTSDVMHRLDEFETIDWVKDLHADSCRKRRMQQRAQYSICGKFRLLLDSSSGWLCVGMIGTLVGIFAILIDIGVSWLSTVKEGVCRDQLWFNREQCCWSFNLTVVSPLYGIGSKALVESLNNQTALQNASSSSLELMHPHVAGSGAQSAFGYYSCDQWYSWERLITGYDGDLEHAGAFIVGCIVYTLLAIGMAGLCAAFVYFIAPLAAGSGIPEVKTILGGFEIRNFLRPWTLVVKVAGLILSVSTGLCIGHDGPMVHVGACCASLLSRLFPKYGRNAAKTRELISAAVAGGIGACFGAPIGGVLFSLEVASYYFPMKTLFRSFFCAMVAAYVARALNPFGEDHFIMFSVDHDTSWHFMELIPFAVLGIFGGIFGALVIRSNKAVQTFRRARCMNRPITYLLILTAVYSLIAYSHPDLRVQEKLFIRKLVSSCSPGDQEDLCDYQRLPHEGFGNATIVSEVYLQGSFSAGPRMGRGIALLCGALIVKFIGLVLVYGVPVPTGVMMPSIMVGSILGRLMGILVEQIVVSQLPDSPYFKKLCKPGRPCIDPGLYAVVGAAACLGGITRATVSLVVIMIELIGGLGHIIPIMVAGMFAKWTGDHIYRGSLYDVQIRLNRYPYLVFDKTSLKMADSTAADVMHPRPNEGPLEILTENSMTMGEIEELLCVSEHNGFPVVESRATRHLVGFVSRWDLIKALELDWTNSTRKYGVNSIVCFTDRTPLMDATNQFVPSAPTSVSFNLIENPGSVNSDPPMLIDVRSIVDLSPTTITQPTPASTVLDMFSSLGLRQVLITQQGHLTGIITKKDVLRFLDKL